MGFVHLVCDEKGSFEHTAAFTIGQQIRRKELLRNRKPYFEAMSRKEKLWEQGSSQRFLLVKSMLLYPKSASLKRNKSTLQISNFTWFEIGRGMKPIQAMRS